MDDKQVEVWARALTARWRGNDESWQLFEPYVRDVLAIVDLPGMLAEARYAAALAAADVAVRHLQTNPRVTATGLKAAILDVKSPLPLTLLAAAAE